MPPKTTTMALQRVNAFIEVQRSILARQLERQMEREIKSDFGYSSSSSDPFSYGFSLIDDDSSSEDEMLLDMALYMTAVALADTCYEPSSSSSSSDSSSSMSMSAEGEDDDDTASSRSYEERIDHGPKNLLIQWENDPNGVVFKESLSDDEIMFPDVKRCIFQDVSKSPQILCTIHVLFCSCFNLILFQINAEGVPQQERTGKRKCIGSVGSPNVN